MKILHLVSFYVPGYQHGGPIVSVHSLNRGLVKKGLEVTVYTTDIDICGVPLNQSVDIDGVSVWYFHCFPFFKRLQYSWSLHQKLKETIPLFDLVHITGIFRLTSLLGSYYAKKYHKPYIISPRGSLMNEPLEMKSHFQKNIYISLIERRNLKNASAVHFTTEAEKEEYIFTGLPQKKLSVIPNGLDVEEFKENIASGAFRKKWNIPADKKIVLFLGRLNWKKGLDTLIPAFSEVIKKEPKAILVLAGPDDEGYGQTVKELIGKWKLEDKVIFTGMLTGDEKIAAYQAPNVFVLPSYSENFGMAVVEAMYFGLPVIITKNVGLAFDVNRSGAGIVINKNEKEVVEAILEILKNPEEAKKMGERGRYLVETEFSPNLVAEKFVKLYNELLHINKNQPY